MRLLDSELRAAVAGSVIPDSAFRDCVAPEPGMPAPPWHQSHYPGKAHLLRDQAPRHHGPHVVPGAVGDRGGAQLHHLPAKAHPSAKRQA